jgi:hypothetical protein
MDCGSWNADELRHPANRRESLILQGIKNGVIYNGIHRFFGRVAGNRGELPLT